uniref:Putative odorant-binding protein 4 n=1 Tax=Chinavia ubica TaxID=1497372 RepID=A0A097QHB2_9HEMI|nr:putative odorant-binding protein 4 [Chinavia ubica]
MRFLILSVVLCYAFAADDKEESKKLLQLEHKIFLKCMADGNITESAVESIFKKLEIPDTRSIKCLLGCYMKGMGYLADDGKIDWKKLDEINKVEYLDPEQEKKALEVSVTCSKSVPQNLGNICDAGYAAGKCFLDEAKKIGLHIFTPEAVQE